MADVSESESLIRRAGVDTPVASATEEAWIEVIRKMDAVYADLVHYQVELEQKNSALEDAQQFIRSVLAAMTDVLIVCDIQGRIQQVNQALERLTGRKQAELLQRPIDELFGLDSQAQVAQFPVRLGSDALVDCEVSLVAADGQPSPLAMNCSSRYDHEGRLVGMVLIGRPVGELRRAYKALNAAHDELKQTQQQLVHSEKMASLGRLVAGVAHELNNPVSFVFGNMHALKRYGEQISAYMAEVESHLPPDVNRTLRERHRIDRIEQDMGPLIDGTVEGAERISEIVQGLRRYSGGQKEPQDRFDLPQVARTATAWVIKACRDKPAVDYELPETLEIVGRQSQVHQILVNLVQNAVDVLEGQLRQQLKISGGSSGGRVWISVTDSGPGIPAADFTRLFDPFFTTKPVGKGTGLGLYISYGLARELGGELSASNSVDGGATFTLTLPREGKADG